MVGARSLAGRRPSGSVEANVPPGGDLSSGAMRVAVLGLGAIGTLVTRTLDGRVAVTRIDRTKAPLERVDQPVDLAIVTTKSQGTAWAAETARRVLAKDGTCSRSRTASGTASGWRPAWATIGSRWASSTSERPWRVSSSRR